MPAPGTDVVPVDRGRTGAARAGRFGASILLQQRAAEPSAAEVET